MQASPEFSDHAASPHAREPAVDDDIDRLLRIALGRPGDADAVARLSARRRNGAALADLAGDVVGSRAFAETVDGRDPVAVLYRNALGRAPSPPSHLSSPAEVAAALVDDPDAIRHLGGVAAASPSQLHARLAVERLYWIAYARAPDAEGLAAFADQLARGRNLVALAEEFLVSAEFQDRVMGHEPLAFLYRNALGQEPDPLPQSPSLAAAAAALVEDPRAIAHLLAHRAAGRSAPAERIRIRAEIGRLYQIVLGRSADVGGLEHFTSEVVAGRDLPAIAAKLLDSAEFVERAKGRSPEMVLQAHAAALGVRAPGPPAPPAALAVRLVRDPDLMRRLPDLASSFPEGVPLDDELYRIWLEAAPHPDPSATTPGERPFLSIVAFLDRPERDLLDAMIAAVRAQTQPDVDLVLVPVQPLDETIARLVARHAAADRRVRLYRPRAWPFATPLRDTLKQCAGTFVACLDQHDRLDSAAAAHLARAAEDADVVLADGDALGSDGERRAPYLAAEWDPDTALAAPPTGLVAIRTSRLAALRPQQRIGLDHATWDLLLQVAAAVPRDRIRHLPAILLSHPEPAPPPRPHDFTHLVDAHLKAARQAGSTAAWDAAATSVRVIRPVPAAPPLVSVIIPTRDRADLLRACLEGLLQRTDYPAIEILVVDNESRDPATHQLFADMQHDPRVRVLPVTGEFNWSRLNNHAVREMRGEVALLLNNDTEVIDPGWLREMVAQALRPEIGAVGAKLLYPDGRIQHAGVVLGPHGRATHVWRFADGGAAGYMGQLQRVRRASAVTGACLALRRAVFQEVGGLDEDDLQVAWNDVDLCLKITAAGYDVLWTPYATLIHIEQASRGSDDAPAAKRRLDREQDHMRRRWGGRLDADPCFSPLLQASEDTVGLSTRDR